MQPDFTEKPSFIISPGEHRFPKNVMNIPIEELTQKLSFSQIIETNNYLTFQFLFKGKNLFLLFDKTDRKSYISNWEFNNSVGIFNDIDGGTGFLPKSYYIENGSEYLVGLCYPDQLKRSLLNSKSDNSVPKYPEKKIELTQLANRLKETDNPILMIVSLKK